MNFNTVCIFDYYWVFKGFFDQFDCNFDDVGRIGQSRTHYTKKWNFPLRISSVNVSKSAVTCGFGHIYWRNSLWKTSFFVQWFLKVTLFRLKNMCNVINKKIVNVVMWPNFCNSSNTMRKVIMALIFLLDRLLNPLKFVFW